MEKVKKLKVTEVAEALGVSLVTVQNGLKLGVFPFGVCVKPIKENEQNKYIIIEERFKKWVKGEI